MDKDGKQDGEVVYRVAPGGSVTFNRSDFNQAYQDLANTSRTLNYVEFVPGDAYTSFAGKISVSGHSDYTKNELSREWFYYSTDRRDSYGIDDLVFRAASGAKDGDYLEIPFWACYDRDDEVKCTLRIVIDKNGSQDTVTLNVAPGATARLDKEAFNKVYQYLSGYNKRTITAVSFYAPDSYRNFDGALYVKNTDLRLQDLTHDETWFYYSSSGAGRNDYLLEDVTFQADRNARRSEEHTSELQAPSIISYAVFCLKKTFFNDTATTEIYTLSLHDALPISRLQGHHAAGYHLHPPRPACAWRRWTAWRLFPAGSAGSWSREIGRASCRERV